MVGIYILGFVVVVAAGSFVKGAITTLWRSVLRVHFKGRKGESRVNRILKRIAWGGGHVKSDVLLPTSKGTTQLDHVLVTKRGVFVVETKNYSGYIEGGENDRYWKQFFGKGRGNSREFLNPIIQNKGHIRALKNVLGENSDVPIYSVVVFAGSANPPIVQGVVKAKQLKSQIHLISMGKPRLSQNQINEINTAINRNEISDRPSRLRHNFRASLAAAGAQNKAVPEYDRSIQEAERLYFPPSQSSVQQSAELNEKHRLTDTHAYLTIRGQKDTIAGFFEKSKRREDGAPVPPGGNFDYFVCPYTGDSFSAAEAGDFYQGLWITYLNNNPGLVDYMKANGVSNFGNSYSCKKALLLYTSDKEGMVAQVKESLWYQNLFERNNLKKKKPLSEHLTTAQVQREQEHTNRSYGSIPAQKRQAEH